MSILACKLFKEITFEKEDYAPLLRMLFGNCCYNAEDLEIGDLVHNALYELSESNPFGFLQMYFAQEYFLHGKSKEEIGRQIAENMDLLLSDLENTTLRFLRHPARSKALAQHIKTED